MATTGKFSPVCGEEDPQDPHHKDSCCFPWLSISARNSLGSLRKRNHQWTCCSSILLNGTQHQQRKGVGHCSGHCLKAVVEEPWLLHLCRDLHTMIRSYNFSWHPVNAIAQGVLRPLQRDVYFSDSFQLTPESCTLADDCTISSCDRKDWQATLNKVYIGLNNVSSWSRWWQMTLIPENTQVQHVSSE